MNDTPVDERELIGKSGTLARALCADAEAIDAARRIPDRVFDKLLDAGLIGLQRPRRYGGSEIGFETVAKITSTLARGSGSVGWVYGVLASHDLLIGLYPEELQQEFWASAQPLFASSYMPTGNAVAADGGYRLSGRWSFCSGIDHAGWIAIGALPVRADGSKASELHLIAVRKSEVEVIDDWYAMGLAGTGSKSVRVDNLFVPHARVLSNALIVAGRTPGASVHSSPYYHHSLWPLIRFAIVAPALGIVRGAYEASVAECSQRTAQAGAALDGLAHAAQLTLADASAKLEAAELLFDQRVRDTCSAIVGGNGVTDDLRVRVRRDQAYVARLCRSAMDALMTLAGGRGIREGGQVQRGLRDVLAISAHPAATWDKAALSFGSHATGRGPTELY